ncbi:prepilin peptidase [Lapidilactobacillus bayanensis]|uniref:prepilin peptidase n=1 Tax=Lapidilactobacillus bayanensis TaxID=2485998 RepID=UPI000F79D86D|nr:prepilin peptidase [Lapidilactobacillus bayanensis]
MVIIFQILLFFLGATFGSFFQLLADRQPLGLDVVFTPSYCDVCQTRLAPYDLIPVIGYWLQQGHCRYCQHEIPSASMCWEFVGGISAIWLFLNWSYWQVGGSLICLLIFQLAIFDACHYYVDQLSLSQLLLFIILLYWHSLTPNILPTLCCLLVLTTISKLTRGLGNADVQLVSMLILAYGLQPMLWVCLLANILILLIYLIEPHLKRFAFIPYLYLALLALPLLPIN